MASRVFFTLLVFLCHVASICYGVVMAPQDKAALTAIKNAISNPSCFPSIECGSATFMCNNVGRVTFMSLPRNKCKGVLSPAIGSLSQLEFLSVQGNEFSGEITSRIVNLKSLTYFDLSRNKFSGNFKSKIVKLMNLTYLDFSYNSLTGALPRSIGYLKALKYMSLDNNKMSGKIPPNIAELTSLEYLSLRNNKFGGVVPSTISNMKSLQVLYLSQNELTGGFPSSFSPRILAFMNISNNYLSGPITLTNIYPQCSSFNFNCLFAGYGPVCRNNFQRNTVQCTKFCNTYQSGGACGGKGVCVRLSGGTHTCICDKGYNNFKTKFTCVRN